MIIIVRRKRSRSRTRSRITISKAAAKSEQERSESARPPPPIFQRTACPTKASPPGVAPGAMHAPPSPQAAASPRLPHRACLHPDILVDILVGVLALIIADVLISTPPDILIGIGTGIFLVNFLAEILADMSIFPLTSSPAIPLTFN